MTSNSCDPTPSPEYTGRLRATITGATRRLAPPEQMSGVGQRVHESGLPLPTKAEQLPMLNERPLTGANAGARNDRCGRQADSEPRLPDVRFRSKADIRPAAERTTACGLKGR